jgi:hypothetical protein
MIFALQSSGFLPLQFFLVSMTQWHHSDPIPNSAVKRCGGEDTWWVTAWENSSMPGLLIYKTSF